jgi:flagellum-specific ATP synthase
VLVEGDDMDDPIGDAVRSIVDGHIVLSRKIAQKGHFPAIDILQSSSRVMNQVISPEHQEFAIKVKRHMATYREAEDLINIGAYKNGSSADIDASIRSHKPIQAFLDQRLNERSDLQKKVGDIAGLVMGT